MIFFTAFTDELWPSSSFTTQSDSSDWANFTSERADDWPPSQSDCSWPGVSDSDDAWPMTSASDGVSFEAVFLDEKPSEKK